MNKPLTIIGLLVWGFGIGFFLFGLSFSNLLLAFPAILFFFVGTFFFIRAMSFRPPNDCIAAVYRLGRVDRIIDSSQWTILVPRLDKPTTPTNLRMRSTHLFEQQALTQDLKLMEIKVHVTFSVDPRRAAEEFQTEELNYKDNEWESIVQQETQSVLIEIARGYTSEDLLSYVGLREFRGEMSASLAERLEDLGIAIHPTHGVRIDQLLPNRKVMQAMIEMNASPSLGTAAQERMQPLLEAMGATPAAGWQALLIGLASAIVNHDEAQKLDSAPKFAKIVGEVKEPPVSSLAPAVR